MKDKYKVVIVGFAHVHINDVAKHFYEHPRIDLCGAADVPPHMPEMKPGAIYTREWNIDYCCKNYNIPKFDDWKQMLDEVKPDLCVVNSENCYHVQITEECAKRGIGVSIEKPMATTLEDCEAMAAAAAESGKFLMIGHNQRLAKAHVRAKQLIDAGTIGRIVTFRTTFGHGGPETWSINPGKNTWFFDKSKAAMGAMADLGVHKTDLIHYLTGERVVRTTAKVATLDKRGENGELIGVDDNAMCIYEMTGGIVGTMTASWTFYGAEDNSTVLYGTKGIMKIYDDPAHSIVVTLADGEKQMYDVEQIQTNDNQTKSGVIDLWIDCLKNGRAPEISGESALYAMRAVFASIKSSELGESVDIPENK